MYFYYYYYYYFYASLTFVLINESELENIKYTQLVARIYYYNIIYLTSACRFVVCKRNVYTYIYIHIYTHKSKTCIDIFQSRGILFIFLVSFDFYYLMDCKIVYICTYLHYRKDES